MTKNVIFWAKLDSGSSEVLFSSSSFLWLFLLFFPFFLISCKSELVELEISTDDILDVINGGNADIEFESVFSLISELDDETKMQLEKMEIVAEKYASIDDFDVTEGEYLGLNISVEGEIPMIYDSNGSIDNSITWPSI